MENLSEFTQKDSVIRTKNPLDPGYFLPDERTLSDFLKFINRLSEQVNFFDENLGVNGDWYDFFISNELFLLSEIENFDLKSVEREKTLILLQFEKSDSIQEKAELVNKLFEQIKLMLKAIDSWYVLSSKYNKKRESTALENELAAAISYRCKEIYNQILFVSSELRALNSPVLLNVDDLVLNPLWGDSAQSSGTPKVGWGAEILNLNYLLKQLLLLHRPVSKTISNLTERAKQLFRENLLNKQDHEPHIGLLLAFLQLFKLLQRELNTVPDRLLTFYFGQVLGQKRRKQLPDTVYCYVNVDPEIGELTIPENTHLIAGQNEEGQDIKYQVKDSVKVSDIQLGSLFTLFVSRNNLIDPGTHFQTVNGIYSYHPESLENLKPFSSLGEEQRFLSDEEKTMKEVSIGFSVSSPTLKLKGGYRTVHLEFDFLPESYQYFLSMLLSVSKTKNQLPEEIFHQVFWGSLHLLYTTPEGWHTVGSYEVIPPNTWSENSIKLIFSLHPSDPEMAVYQEEVHGEGLGLNQPLLKIILKNQHVFHPYSFLQFLELEKIKIAVEVKQLKSFTLHSDFGLLDHTIPFDLLGPSPKVGSYLLIGNDEIFSKDLDELHLGWTFHGLPIGEDMKSYFGGYPYGIENDSFKVKIQALSDFRFMPKEDKNALIVNLFEVVNSQICDERKISEIDLDKLAIIPDYNLKIEDSDDYFFNKKTGYLKIELVAPSMGFGFDVYSSVYSKSIEEATNRQLEKPKSGFSFDVPKEPFSPMARELYLDYSASSEINFLGTKSFTNQSEKQENFIQIHPFGKKFLLKDGLVYENRLLPFFELQGALFLGIQSNGFPEEFSVLFAVGKNENWSYGDAPRLDWFYLANDEWKAFKLEDILFDSSFGLTRSGIISFKSPKDINLNNLVMPDNYYWICCRTKDQQAMSSVISGIYFNAFSAEAILEKNKEHLPVLAPESIKSFEFDIPGILEINQPLASVGGRPEEGKMQFYKRISESLKHRFRAVTKWDIEKMLMNEFDWLGFVRVFGNFGNEDFVKPGSITVVGMPKIEDRESFYLPKLNPGQLKEIELYLSKVLNPFVKFKVINPHYEFLMIKGKIKFSSADNGLHFKKLYQDLLRETCPWFYHDLETVFFRRETKKSEILNLITSRDYVNFFTGFGLAQMFENEAGGYFFVDGSLLDDGMETITIGRPWSILIPYPLKKIELLEEEKYFPAEPFNLEDMIIGENLIITSDDSEPESSAKPIINKVPKPGEFYHFNFQF